MGGKRKFGNFHKEAATAAAFVMTMTMSLMHTFLVVLDSRAILRSKFYEKINLRKLIKSTLENMSMSIRIEN